MTARSEWPEAPTVQSVPELTHLSPTPRLPQHELVRFEKMMEVADATTAAAFEVRKRQRKDSQDSPCAIGPVSRVSLGFGDSDEDDDVEEEGLACDTAIARALVKTIAATTGVKAPERLKTTHEAITWASKSILDSRTAAIMSTRRERYSHSLDPDQTVHAMDLIERLNRLLAGPAPTAQSPSELPSVAPSL